MALEEDDRFRSIGEHLQATHDELTANPSTLQVGTDSKGPEHKDVDQSSRRVQKRVRVQDVTHQFAVRLRDE